MILLGLAVLLVAVSAAVLGWAASEVRQHLSICHCRTCTARRHNGE